MAMMLALPDDNTSAQLRAVTKPPAGVRRDCGEEEDDEGKCRYGCVD